MSRRDARRDREVAALLSARALIEIRYLASRSLSGDRPADAALERIRFLADLCHNLPVATRSRRWRPSRKSVPVNDFHQATAKRPMTWTWNTAGPEARTWMLGHVEREMGAWTPPPPLPVTRRKPRPMSFRQWVGVLCARWPVRTPAGHEQLPAEARVLKALSTDAVCALYDEAKRLRLGLGYGGPWLRAHLAPDGVHYLVPDPANYYWPGTPASRGRKIEWWQCTALLRMSDGEQVSGMIAVLPATFTALAPPGVARRRQVRLVYLARNTRRDTYLWGRDHKAECDPLVCGYFPEVAEGPPAAGSGG